MPDHKLRVSLTLKHYLTNGTEDILVKDGKKFDVTVGLSAEMIASSECLDDAVLATLKRYADEMAEYISEWNIDWMI